VVAKVPLEARLLPVSAPNAPELPNVLAPPVFTPNGLLYRQHEHEHERTRVRKGRKAKGKRGETHLKGAEAPKVDVGAAV
jgi:hypothetical protein